MKSLLACIVSVLTLLLFSTPSLAQTPDCASFSIVNNVNSAPVNNGALVVVHAGDIFTFTMTSLGATSASWRIVGNGSGVPTFAAGGTLPGTLNYVAPSAGTYGVGYLVDAIAGGAAQITGSCQAGPAPVSTPVPALSNGAMLIMALLMAIAAALGWRRYGRD